MVLTGEVSGCPACFFFVLFFFIKDTTVSLSVLIRTQCCRAEEKRADMLQVQ